MYYPIGWPKIIDVIGLNDATIRQICCDRVKILFAILTDDSLAIYYTNVSVLCHSLSVQMRRCVSARHCDTCLSGTRCDNASDNTTTSTHFINWNLIYLTFVVLRFIFSCVAVCANCDNTTNGQFDSQTWYKLFCWMETRFQYAGRCCKFWIWWRWTTMT